MTRTALGLAALASACHGSEAAIASDSASTTTAKSSSNESGTTTDPTSSSTTEPLAGSSSTSSVAGGSSSSSTSSSSSSSTGEPREHPGPPPIVLASEVTAQGGWIFVVSDAPLGELVVLLDGVVLTDLDAQLPVSQPVGVWRVPDDAPVGEATLRVAWADYPDDAVSSAIEVFEPAFVDVAEATGLAAVHDVAGTDPACAQSHTGVAIGDVDGDARPDMYVGNVGSAGRLHRNLGDVDLDGLPDFEDVTDDAGLGAIDAVAMATFVDLDGDGDLDLFVGRRGENRMLDNRLVPDGALAFVDVSAAVGLDHGNQRTMGAAFGDYDGDDDLDVYVVNHAWCFPSAGTEVRAEDHLYRNDGGVFVERTAELSPIAGRGVGFSAAWVDLERDGDPDLVVINDHVGTPVGDPNEVWRNDGPDGAGGWRFTDVGASSGVAIPGVEGMGLGLGDVDGDGFVDLAFSNRGANVLMLNLGDGTFVDASASAGIERALLPWGRPSVTWATHLWDHDNDGDLDLYFTGGTVSVPVPVSDAFFDNTGDGTFVERTWESALADPAPGKGSALGDLDGDGAWDLVTAAWGDDLRVWHNQAVPPGHHWIDIELTGRGGNRAALGSIVEITTAAGMQTCFHTQRPALGAGGETACHFGLGTQTEITALRITWPDAVVQDLAPPAIDTRASFVQPPR